MIKRLFEPYEALFRYSVNHPKVRITCYLILKKIQPSQYFALHAYDGTQITGFKAHREVIIHHVY